MPQFRRFAGAISLPTKTKTTPLLAAALACVTPGLCTAQLSNLNWDAASGDWNNPNNWSGAFPGVPDDSRAAVIDNEGTAQLRSTGAQTSFIQIGKLNGGRLEIIDGGQLEIDTSASIGLQAGSIGTVIVDGPTSQWSTCSVTFNLTVGESGTGTLAVSNGGKVSNTTSSLSTSVGEKAGSIGLITIDGVGSSLTHTLASLIIGDAGNGALEISNGGLAENTYALVGRAAGGSGSVTVTGTGSTWNNDTGLTIGDFGTGTLSIENDGVVSVGSGTGSLSLGRAGGSGTLNIGNGAAAGVLSATSVSGGTGTATINFNHTDTNYHFTDNGTATGNAIVISGSTAVNFIGSGTTTLTGNHTYTGNTTVNNGTLRLADSNRISDAGNMVINGGTFDLNNFNETVANLYGTGGVINLGNSGNSTLTVNQTVNSTYGGSFIGVANSFSHHAFIKNGPATLTLGGTSLQTGSAQIAVNAGRLAVAGGNAIADTSGLTGAGEFELLSDETISNLSMGNTGKVLLNNNTLTIRTVPAMAGDNHAAISGTGSIVISGDGGQNMHTASNYTGTTTLSSGQLNTFNPYALGNNSAVTVNTNAALSLGDHLRIGSLAGNGTVNLAGTPGPNTLTSGANNASTIFSGVLSGADGRLTKAGTGTLTLTGTNTYTGATTVDAGALVVNGSIANSAITVNGSGRLGGNGLMGDLFLKGGTLAPGNSIGSITVANVDFSSGGIYEVEVNASGDSDKIIASGNAALTGGRVSVLPEPGSYAITTDYTIVQAGSIAGEFDSVSVDLPDFAFLQASLGYSATTVSLRLKRNDNVFNALGTTANTVNTANALSQAYSRGLLTDVTDNLIVLDKANAQKALESLSGNQLSQGTTLALFAGRRFNALLNKRSRKVTPYPGSSNHLISSQQPQRLGKVENGHFAALSDTSTTAAGLSLSQNNGVWLAPQAGFGSIDGNGKARGTDYKYGGIAAGYDYWLNNTVLTGASLSYSETRADDQNLNSVETALYGRMLLNSNRYLYGSIGIGRHQVSSVRRVKAGTLVSQATGHYDIDTHSASLEFGQAFAIDQNVTITPFLGVEYTHLDRADFTETGAGQASLNSAENRQESLRSQLGLRLTTDFTTASARQWRIDASLAWLHEFADTTANVDAAFTGAPSIQFNTTGPDLSRDQAQLQLNITTTLSNRSSLKIGYQGDLSRTHQEHNAYAAFTFKW